MAQAGRNFIDDAAVADDIDNVKQFYSDIDDDSLFTLIGARRPRDKEAEELLDPPHWSYALARGAFMGFGELPGAVVRGAISTPENMIGLAASIFDAEDKVHAWFEDAWFKPKKRETVIGGFAEAASQFLVGFGLAGLALRSAGTVLGARALTKLGTLPRASMPLGEAFKQSISGGLVRGAMSDFLSFDGHEERLSDLIEAFPGLSNPVSQFLKSNPDDPEVIGRLKNAIEGMPLGVAADGLVYGIRAYSKFKRMARAKQLEEKDKAIGEFEDIKRIHPNLTDEEYATIRNSYYLGDTKHNEVIRAVDRARGIVDPDAGMNYSSLFYRPDDATFRVGLQPHKGIPKERYPIKFDGGVERAVYEASPIVRGTETIEDVEGRLLKAGRKRELVEIKKEEVGDLSPAEKQLEASKKVMKGNEEKRYREKTATDLYEVRREGYRVARESEVGATGKGYKYANIEAIPHMNTMERTLYRFMSTLTGVDSDLRREFEAVAIRTSAKARAEDTLVGILRGEDIKGHRVHKDLKQAVGLQLSSQKARDQLQGPYILLSERGQSLKDTAVKNVVVLHEGADNMLANLRKEFGDFRFFSAKEARDYIEQGVLPGYYTRKVAKEAKLDRAAKAYEWLEEQGYLPGQIKQMADAVESRLVSAVSHVPPEGKKTVSVEPFLERLTTPGKTNIPGQEREMFFPSNPHSYTYFVAPDMVHGINWAVMNSREDVINMWNELIKLNKNIVTSKTDIAKKQLDNGKITQAEYQKVVDDLANNQPLERVHSYRSFGEITAAAKMRDAVQDAQNNLKLGWNSEQIAAYKISLGTATAQLAKLVDASRKNYEIGVKAPEIDLAVLRLKDIFDVLAEEFFKARSESGRALAANKIVPGAKNTVLNAKRIRALSQKMGPDEDFRKMVNRLDVLLKQDDAVLKLELLPTTNLGQKLGRSWAETFVNGILSLPKTPLVNFAGNTGTLVNNVVEKMIAAGIGKVVDDPNAMQFREAAYNVYGMWAGKKDAFIYATKAANANRPSRGNGQIGFAFDEPGRGWRAKGEEEFQFPDNSIATKFALTEGRARAISHSAWGLKEDKGLGAFVNYLGAFINAPRTASLWGDEFFKTLAYRGEIYAHAQREAASQLSSGKIKQADYAKTLADLIENPPDNIKFESGEIANYLTFNRSSDYFTAMLIKGRNAIDSYVPVGSAIAPFIQTPTNILKYMGEHTPFASYMSGRWNTELNAGGPRSHLALAQLTTGGMIYGAGYELYLGGMLSGRGPLDNEQRQALERTGWQPYSLKVGDKYYQFNRFDPFGLLLETAADLYEVQYWLSTSNMPSSIGPANDTFEVAATGAAYLAKVLQDRTYLQSFGELLAMTDFKSGSAERFFANRLATMFVPYSSLLRGSRTYTDPEKSMIDNFIDTWRNKIPGLSASLPKQYDLFGREKQYPDNFIDNFINPMTPTKSRIEPIDREFLEHNMEMAMPQRNLNFSGVRFSTKNRSHVYARYLQLQGNELHHPEFKMGQKDLLNAIVEGRHSLSETYKGLRGGNDNDPGSKKRFITDIMRQYRALAREQLLVEDPDTSELVSRVQRSRQRRLEGETGLEIR